MSLFGGIVNAILVRKGALKQYNFAPPFYRNGFFLNTNRMKGMENSIKIGVLLATKFTLKACG